MLHPDEVVPLLLAAVPSFADAWRDLEHDPIHVDEESGERLHYLDAGEFTRHLAVLQRRGATEELQRAFAVIEVLHVDGDHYVQELATIGFLEGIQSAASHADDVSASDFERYLGPVSQRWWSGLDEFWAGRAPTVQAGLPALVVDGDRFDDFAGFVRVFSDRLDDFSWQGSLDAFNDILRGGCGTPAGGFEVRWLNSERSRAALGWDATIHWLEETLTRCHSSQVRRVTKQLRAARRHKGTTLFEWIIEMIRDHGPGGSEPEGNVHLRLL